MLRKYGNRFRTVGEKVEELLSKRCNTDSSSEEESSTPKIADFNEDEYELPDARNTEIRKRNVKLLSEQSSRYAGTVSSRKTSESSKSSYSFHDEESGDRMEYETTSSEDESIQEDMMENEIYDDQENMDFISKSHLDNEIQKGICVQNQLRIWERLLELRIQMQKFLHKSNQLPSSSILNEAMHTNDELKIKCKDTNEKIRILLTCLLELQRTLYSQQSEVKNATKQSLKQSAAFLEGAKIPTNIASEYLSAQFDEFRVYRNSVLLKWDDRTKLLSATSNKTDLEQYDVIKKIEYALLNKAALIEKSQSIVNNSEINNEDNNDSKIFSKIIRNKNVYDDSDFYHQQLRELIEYKTNTSANISEVTKQYANLQKLRQKIKKKVDTKATKGRKLRYAVHKKLVNFMAPDDTSTWNDEATDELARSLFI